jgi:hypothetical protein
MNDQRFFDLAMKVIALQANDAERAELDALFSRDAGLRAEFARLQADGGLAKEVVPLMAACATSTGEFPAYVCERLQTSVRQTLGRPKPSARESPDILSLAPTRGLPWVWRWAVGLAVATALVVILALPMFRTLNAPTIQLAVLDMTGRTRGAEADEADILKDAWQGESVRKFSDATELAAWEQQWPNSYRPSVKVIYDPAAAEIRVLGRSRGKAVNRIFPVENDLPATLQKVRTFIQEQIKK